MKTETEIEEEKNIFKAIGVGTLKFIRNSIIAGLIGLGMLQIFSFLGNTNAIEVLNGTWEVYNSVEFTGASPVFVGMIPIFLIVSVGLFWYFEIYKEYKKEELI